jgi:hypothetical protein
MWTRQTPSTHGHHLNLITLSSMTPLLTASSKLTTCFCLNANSFDGSRVSQTAHFAVKSVALRISTFPTLLYPHPSCCAYTKAAAAYVLVQTATLLPALLTQCHTREQFISVHTCQC